MKRFPEGPQASRNPRTDLTPEQIHALAKLAIDESSPVPTINSVLDVLVDTLQPKWIRNFLFTTSALHVSHFLNPTPSPASLTCLVQTASVGPRSGIPTLHELSGAADVFSGHLFFAPLFISDHTTLGVGVVDATESTDVPWRIDQAPSQAVRSNFRFVRDAHTRTLLIAYDRPASNCCVIMTSRLETSTRFNTCTSLFQRKLLADSVLHQDGKLQLEHLSPALMMFQSSNHRRNCVVCSSSNALECSCELRLQSPAHPLDSEFFHNEMLQHLSVSEGVTERVNFMLTGSAQRESVGSWISMIGVMDQSISQRLKAWSTTEHAGVAQASPLESVLLLDDRETQLLAGSDAVHEGDSGVDDDELKKAGQARLLKKLVPPIDTVVNPKEVNCLRPALSVAGQSSCTTQRSAGLFYSLASSAEHTLDEDWWNERCGPDVLCMEGPELRSEVLETLTGSERVSLPTGPSNSEDRNEVPLTGNANGQATGTDSAIDQATNVREQRAEARRQKNREAARRSNLKYKAMRDAMKAELEIARRKIPPLRQQEVSLRAENLQLRRALKEEEDKHSR